VSLYSEGAALLLVWSANIIKNYACYKKFGVLEGEEFDKQIR
jgi:hypothetical protein